MLAKPSFLIVGPTFFALFVVAAAILSPVPAGLELLAPEYVGALRLRAAQGIPRGRTCDMTGDAWQYYWLMRGRHPEVWFQSVLDQAATPEARLYALAGLHETDSAAFLRALGTLPARTWASSVLVFGPTETGERVPAISLLPTLVSGQLGAELNWGERPEC